ncbi:MAG: hypothetical protein HYZ29_09335 [Myxococcales bacterium]|nr:hypothetical protein [Myxococcales bacterium]
MVPRAKAQPKPEAPPAPAAPPAAGGGAFDLFGGGFDSDHFGTGSAISAGEGTQSSGSYDGSSMDLDDGDAAAGLSLELSSYRPPAPEGSVAPQAPAAPSAPSTTPGAPAPSLAPALPSVEASAVALVARYGPAPSAIYLAPLYAFRVLTRQRELRAELARLNGEIAAQDRKLDELLASLASDLRATLEGDSRFSAAYEPVRQLEGIAQERGAVLSQTNQQLDAQNAQLEQQLQAIQAQLPPLEAERDRAAAEVAEREAVLARVAAKQKRFLIEARSIKMSAQQGAPPNTPLSPEAAQKVQALDEQAAAMQPEVSTLQQGLVEAQGVLQQARGQLGLLGQHTRRIQDQQKALTRQFRGQLSAASASVSEAQRELTTALAGVGRVLLTQEASLALPAATLSAIRGGEVNHKRLAEASALHLAALDSYDRQVVKKGYLLVAGVVGGLCLLIVLVIVL